MLVSNNSDFQATQNRAFCYGDGIFETIRLQHKQPLFWDLHLQRIKNGLATLNFEQPDRLYFDHLHQELLEKAAVFAESNLRARISFVRNQGGFYLPQDNHFQHFIQLFPLSTNPFPVYEKGLTLAVAQSLRLSCDKLSNCKTLNGLRFILAAQEAQQQQADEAILLNQYERIAEASNANLFIIKDKQLITPALTEGCIAGVCRAFLLQKAAILGCEVVEKSLNLSDLAQAEAIFLSNAIAGLRPVAQILDIPNVYFGIEKVAYLTQNLQKLLPKG